MSRKYERQAAVDISAFWRVRLRSRILHPDPPELSHAIPRRMAMFAQFVDEGMRPLNRTINGRETA
jgi:hypothetical protein